MFEGINMSKLFIKFNEDNELSSKLSDVRETAQHQYIKNLPIDTYVRKIRDVELSLKTLINYSRSPIEYSESPEHPVKSYIQSLASFYDNIFRILKYTQNLDDKTDLENAIIWINKNGNKLNKSFFRKTQMQQRLISRIDNKLKHDDVRIKECEISKKFISKSTGIETSENIKGFFVNSMVDDKGFWGPDPKIHNYIDDITATAFSYNFFILNTCYSLLHWLEVLGNILKKDLSKKSSYQNHSLSNILNMVSGIEENFFPDEYKKAYVKVIKEKEGFSINYPYNFPKLKKDRLLLEGRIIGGMDFNPRTSSSKQKIPYFNLAEKHWQ